MCLVLLINYLSTLCCSRNDFLSSIESEVGEVLGPKYDGKYLRTLTTGLLGDLTLKETLTNVIIPTFDVKHLQPVIFSTIDVRPQPYI